MKTVDRADQREPKQEAHRQWVTVLAAKEIAHRLLLFRQVKKNVPKHTKGNFT